MKKIDFEQTFKKLENASGKVEVIMRNRLIIALFLIVDGITILLNPDSSLTGMARNIIMLVLLAAFSALMTNLCAKPRDKKSIIVSIVVLILGIISYIYPDIVSSYIQLLLSLFIIYNGAMNIFNILNLNKLSEYTSGIAKKYDNLVNSKKVDKDVDKGLEEQANKYLQPIRSLTNKSTKSSALYIFINLATIILGILLLFSSFSMVVWGIIFIYTGVSDLLMSMRSMNISTKIKEKKYKDIIYDSAKEDEKY